MSKMEGGKGTQPMSTKMKEMGRGLAKAGNQKSGGKGYAGGGPVKEDHDGDEGATYRGSPGAPDYTGGGKKRGTGAQTKSLNWKGAM